MTKDGKIAIGIIGFGGIARGAHLTSGYRKLPEWCDVVAVADILPERCNDASGQYGIAETYDDHKKLLERDDIDAVSVCTGNYAHAPITIDALRAGKHVLCEKPMAMNAQECKAMIAAQKETGKKLQIGFNMRYSPGAQSLKRAIENGQFGDIYHAAARAIRRRRVPAKGVFINKELNGGGPLIDIGVHITDMTLWLMGHPKPVATVGSAVCKMGKTPGLVGEWGQWDTEAYTVEDFASAYVRFEDGRTMTLLASFLANIDQEHFDTQLFGTGAGAFFDANAGKYTLYREEFGTLTDTTTGWLPSVASTHGKEIEMFVKAIREDLTIESVGAATGEQALMVTQIMDAIYKSSETGKEVAII
ncbi:Gfo/Idh/MocA family protein [Armatimonas sp.]|uniref:Gfo/Idh/MocA family protein n=1 Tax=Armatimonas sp. TaxID=1872638 RepID=UPI00374D4D53